MSTASATTYEPFATQPEYVALNVDFVETIVPHVESARVVADIACGTGLVSGLLADALARDSGYAAPRVVGIDRSRESLEIARDAAPLAGTRLCMEGSADRLPLRSDVADVAVIANAIHLFDDLDATLREIHRVLHQGGVFAFNTTYHAGGNGDDMRLFYGEFFGEVRRRLKPFRSRIAPDGDAKASRARVPAGRLTTGEYADAVGRHGFTIVHLTDRVVHLTRESFEAIVSYGEFAALWSSYPSDLVVPALIDAVAAVWDRFSMTTLPRRWLEVVAVKA
jgi:ubiquinone/menaquinone biosynthesis C-methylase UbiE